MHTCHTIQMGLRNSCGVVKRQFAHQQTTALDRKSVV